MRLPARPRRRRSPRQVTTMKTMQARYSGVCPLCEGAIVPGQSIDYGAGVRARHSSCNVKPEAPSVEAARVLAPSVGEVEADHPKVRAGVRCPVCGRGKDRGCLVCWPCYRAHDFRNNADACANAIDDAEEYLAGNTYGRPWNERGPRPRRPRISDLVDKLGGHNR